jgi:hypothetical protein
MTTTLSSSSASVLLILPHRRLGPAPEPQLRTHGCPRCPSIDGLIEYTMVSPYMRTKFGAAKR